MVALNGLAIAPTPASYVYPCSLGAFARASISSDLIPCIWNATNLDTCSLPVKMVAGRWRMFADAVASADAAQVVLSSVLKHDDVLARVGGTHLTPDCVMEDAKMMMRLEKNLDCMP